MTNADLSVRLRVLLGLSAVVYFLSRRFWTTRWLPRRRGAVLPRR